MDKFLEQFKILAHYKKFSTASEHLHISQPALTRNIKKLEEQMGVALFERLPRGVLLTTYGEIFLKRVNNIEREYMYALRELHAIKKGEDVKLRIGADNLWAEAYLADILSEFYAKFPSAEVRVKAGPVQSLLKKLINGDIDIIFGDVSSPVDAKLELIKEKITQVKFVVIARKEHPLYKNTHIDLKTLSKQKWVIYQHADSQVWSINELFYKKGLKPAKISLHTSFLPQAIKQMSHHDFLMYIPDKHIDYMQEHGLFQLKGITFIHQFDSGILYQKKIMDFPGPRSLLPIIRKYKILTK